MGRDMFWPTTYWIESYWFTNYWGIWGPRITTYYADMTLGDDSNAGTLASPWQYAVGMSGYTGAGTLSAGDSMLLKKGETWREQLTVPSSGSAGSPITFGAYGGGDDPIIDGESTRDACLYGTDKDYITIDGLTVQGSNIGGVWNDRGDNWIIKNGTFSGNYVSILVRGHETEEEPVVGLEIYSNTSTAMDLRGTSSAKVHNNIFDFAVGGKAFGVQTHTGDNAGGGANSSGIKIYENDIPGFDGGGIILKYTTAAEVYRNHIHDGDGLGIAVNSYSTGAILTYNLIHDLTNNTGDTLFNGIDINIGSTGGFAYNNTIYKVHMNCFTLESDTVASDGWTVKNNIFDSSQNEDHSGIDASIYIDGGISTFTFDTNLVYISDAIVRGYATITDIAVWNATAGVGTDLEADPLFIDAANADFHLQDGSPCINRGVKVGLTQDYEGNPVIGGVVDIGAYDTTPAVRSRRRRRIL